MRAGARGGTRGGRARREVGYGRGWLRVAWREEQREVGRRSGLAVRSQDVDVGGGAIHVHGGGRGTKELGLGRDAAQRLYPKHERSGRRHRDVEAGIASMKAKLKGRKAAGGGADGRDQKELRPAVGKAERTVDVHRQWQRARSRVVAEDEPSVLEDHERAVQRAWRGRREVRDGTGGLQQGDILVGPREPTFHEGNVLGREELKLVL